MRVLVTGGAGYIGSVVTEELLNDNHEVVVYDNLQKGHRAAVDPRSRFIQAAHLLGLKILDERSATYNLGCGGDGYTVKEVIDTARRVTKQEIPTRIVQRRAGEPAVLIASSAKIERELGWRPKFQELSVIIQSAWDWMEAHPDGY